MTVYSLLMDLCFSSILILIGMLIRSKITFVQKSFVPASLIAGFLGLILGPNVLNIIPFSESISSYAGVLTIFVFASIGINGFSFSANDMKKDLNRMGAHASYKVFVLAAQVAIPIAFSILVISKIVPDINYGFGLLLTAGFYGGHGTAAAVGTTFEKLGWAAATDLAMTTATIGILTGVFGGLIFIKWATRKGYTQYVKDFSQISDDLKTGLIPEEKRVSFGFETISPIALDPLAFHIALLLVPSGLGYLLNQFIETKFGLDLPTFTVSFLLAILMFMVFGKGEKGLYKYVDSKIVSRLGSAATDFLVFFGVASIKLTVIVEYALPLALLTISGIFVVVMGLIYFGPRMNYETWFERSIFVFGYGTGVFSIGLTLLRIVDPENKSKTLTDTAIVGPLNTPIEMFIWAAGPAMLLGGQHWVFVGIYIAIALACIIINKVFKWWYADQPLAGRPDVNQ